VQKTPTSKEIQALSSAIAKANKNFLVYCLFCVPKMLKEHAQCSHLDGLEIFMVACDASIFNVVPDDISKLYARIVKKWWSSYGLPYVIGAFRIELEVRLSGSVLCFHALLLLIYNFVM
jgi:hypothetical protein